MFRMFLVMFERVLFVWMMYFLIVLFGFGLGDDGCVMVVDVVRISRLVSVEC